MANKLCSLAFNASKILCNNVNKQGITKTVLRPMASKPATAIEGIWNKQNTYQSGDTKIHVVGGALDGILYRFTMGLCSLSVVLVLYNILDMARPKKK